MTVFLPGFIENQVFGIFDGQVGNALQFDDFLPFQFPGLLFECQDIADPGVQCFFLLFQDFQFAFQGFFLLFQAVALTLQFGLFFADIFFKFKPGFVDLLLGLQKELSFSAFAGFLGFADQFASFGLRLFR